MNEKIKEVSHILTESMVECEEFYPKHRKTVLSLWQGLIDSFILHINEGVIFYEEPGRLRSKARSELVEAHGLALGTPANGVLKINKVEGFL